MTPKRYATLRHRKMHSHTKFGIPISNNIGDIAGYESVTAGQQNRANGSLTGREPIKDLARVEFIKRFFI